MMPANACNLYSSAILSKKISFKNSVSIMVILSFLNFYTGIKSAIPPKAPGKRILLQPV